MIEVGSRVIHTYLGNIEIGIVTEIDGEFCTVAKEGQEYKLAIKRISDVKEIK